MPLYYKNSSFSNDLSNFNDVAGRTNTSGGAHAARVFETPELRLQNRQHLRHKFRCLFHSFTRYRVCHGFRLEK